MVTYDYLNIRELNVSKINGVETGEKLLETTISNSSITINPSTEIVYISGGGNIDTINGGSLGQKITLHKYDFGDFSINGGNDNIDTVGAGFVSVKDRNQGNITLVYTKNPTYAVGESWILLSVNAFP